MNSRTRAYSSVALGIEEYKVNAAETWSKITCITPCTVFTRWAPLGACPLLQMMFVEAQLYTNGSTTEDGTVGDFLKGKEIKRSTEAIEGTNDGN